MAHLSLDTKKIARCRELAEIISGPVEDLIKKHTTAAIERTTLRLIGVNGAVKRNGQWYPEVNAIIDDLHTDLPAERKIQRDFPLAPRRALLLRKWHDPKENAGRGARCRRREP